MVVVLNRNITFIMLLLCKLFLHSRLIFGCRWWLMLIGQWSANWWSWEGSSNLYYPSGTKENHMESRTGWSSSGHITLTVMLAVTCFFILSCLLCLLILLIVRCNVFYLFNVYSFRWLFTFADILIAQKCGRQQGSQHICMQGSPFVSKLLAFRTEIFRGFYVQLW
jgi:hypothetical protein